MWEGWMWHFWGEDDPTGSHFGFCSRGRQLLPLVRNCLVLSSFYSRAAAPFFPHGNPSQSPTPGWLEGIFMGWD